MNVASDSAFGSDGAPAGVPSPDRGVPASPRRPTLRTRHHRMPFGAQWRGDGHTAFRLWAPSAGTVAVQLEAKDRASRHGLHRRPGGWHEAVLPAEPGTRYRFGLDNVGGGLLVPDPASRFNPDGVHGPSEVVDPQRHRWRDSGWRGRPWHEAVICELHVGTFTDQGTFRAAAERLRDLAETGFTAVELMPVAAFPGARNWGYDGVLPFAPAACYGTPDDLKHLVETAHGLGLMVLLDVVYNHFGPEGNYLHAGCPEFFNPALHTPWGPAIDFSGGERAPVRDFFVHNALYWVEEFHFDGLRLDAVHAITDPTPRHIVCAIADALRDGPGRGRDVHLVLENDRNQAGLLARDEHGLPRCATAQWNDDLHHAAHVLATGEADGYYADYAQAPANDLAKALATGYVYQGQASAQRSHAPHGEPSAHLPSGAFVSFLQNHDQIGNRALGERLGALASGERLDALYAALLLSPHVPMMFMGEDFAAASPFLYFCDFGPELAGAVSAGRRNEFARFEAFRDEAARQRIPDPNDPHTFALSRLDWSQRDRSPHRERLAQVRALLEVRRNELVPLLPLQRSGGEWRSDAGLLQVAWRLGEQHRWTLALNLGPTTRSIAAPSGRVIHALRTGAQGDADLLLQAGGVLVALHTSA